MEIIDPKTYDLPPKTVLRQMSTNRIAIVINRKSRIIMADGKKILEKAEKIRSHNKEIEICFETSAPVCSKTAGFLREKGIVTINK